MNIYIISKTAIQNGCGTDRYKSVTHLTKEEREAARTETPVYFKSAYLSGGSHGTHWRVVLYRFGRYYPRVPAAETIAMLETVQ
jgi:hypothetical protein